MKSMTGYAKQQCMAGGMAITVEIKTLNSKQLDLNVKLPQRYRSKDLEVRTMLSQLNRGKIDIFLSEIQAVSGNSQIDKELLVTRLNALNEVASDLSLPVEKTSLFECLVRQPEIWATGTADDVTDEDWAVVADAIKQAVSEVESFRHHEGEVMAADLKKHIDMIDTKLSSIPQYEDGRISVAKERINRYFSDFAVKEVDHIRFEQELIYYLEKLDITEEKVRLAKHITFFRDTMQNEEICGRKLAFVAQEMGREINTIGSKANQVEIQRLVVEMKDELEKIKEQLGNIL